MSQRHTDPFIADHDMLAGWVASATCCWLVLSAAALLAGVAHLFDVI